MDDHLTWQKITLKLRNPFRISYGTSESRQAFWVRLINDAGWGEGTIPPYYGVDDDAMKSLWQRAADNKVDFPDDPALIPEWIGEGPAPARCGLDLALHDRISRNLRIPLYKLLQVPFPKSKPSAFTFEPAVFEQRVFVTLDISCNRKSSFLPTDPFSSIVLEMLAICASNLSTSSVISDLSAAIAASCARRASSISASSISF